ncbi:acetoacetate decarboxylase family protein [Streptomyces oceani]|uniref:Enduracididine biosynthesis enzyme MppR n=1 Tax=Streptomyces oceani TaxID=1075402 RepID=A0A1E7KPC7_9ACTN|nr:acetoacetate decarboxylase family protein [Streptomyces oceani]OEV05744.1 enduracididine biosynthesis enzyme MppR [Streptomyces oceani]
MSLQPPKELAGYSLPLSPTGVSSMITPPPWHFSGNMLWVDCRVDPDAAQRFLPEGVSASDPGAAAAVFSDWQWCSADKSELTDPARCQFSEFLLLLGCQYEGRAMARCPYAWVDSAVSLARGWIQGMPKQFGSIRMSRPIAVGRAATHHEPGGRMSGSLAVHDRRIAEATVTLTEKVDSPPDLSLLPLVHSEVTPPWLAGAGSRQRLITSCVEGVEFSEVWSGVADMRFFEDGVRALDTDLATLIPEQVGKGYSFSYAETLTGGEVLA